MSIKIIKSSLFNEMADYKHQRWFEVLPPNITYEDLFDPKLWANFTGKFQRFDLVRVRAENGSFDVQLCVRSIDVGGIHMEVWPQFEGKSGEAAIVAATEAQEESVIKIVPLSKDGKPIVRVDHKPATKWRLIGLNGEVERGFETRADAEAAMATYLVTARLVMPEPVKEPDAKPDKSASKTRAAA